MKNVWRLEKNDILNSARYLLRSKYRPWIFLVANFSVTTLHYCAAIYKLTLCTDVRYRYPGRGCSV